MTRTLSGRPLALALATLVAALLLATLPTVGSAQQAAPGGSLALLGLTGTVGPGSRAPEAEVADEVIPDDVDVRVAVTVRGPVDDLRLTLELHPDVAVRSVLHTALDDGVVDTRALATTTLVIEDPPPTDSTLGVELQLDDENIPWPDDPGVLPVAVSLFDGSTLLDSVVTAVIWLPRTVVPTLRAVAVIPLSGATTVGPMGRPSADPLPATTPGGPFRTLLRTLADRPDLAIAASPDVPLLEELADRADGWTTRDGVVIGPEDGIAVDAAVTLAELRAVLVASPVDPVLGPYADADLAALASASDNPSVADLAPEAVATAQTRLQAVVGRAPDLGTYLATTTTTPAVIDVVRDKRVILPYDQTAGSPAANEPALRPALSFVASDGGRVIPALVTDPHVDEILRDTSVDAGVAARKQRLRAELAALWLEAPADPRVVVVLPPEDWDPSARLAGAWFDVLGTSPWLILDTARDAAEAAGPPTDVPTLVASSTSRMSASLQARFARVLQLLGALDAAAGDLAPTEIQLVLPRLRDTVLRATADAVGDPAAAERVLDEVTDIIDSGFGTLRISAPNTTLDGTGELPVTLSRTDGGDINVVVRVESAGRLTWVGRGQRQNVQLPDGGTRTVAFQTRALSRGTFPVTVTVLDPTETRVLATTDLTVRNTALNGAVLGVIIVLVIGLLIAGRRRRRPALELVAADADGDGATP